jgi:hypothetical protein
MKSPHPTRNIGIRIDESYYLIGKLLRSSHPSISHSKVYSLGLKKTIEDLIEKGFTFPDDPTTAILKIKQKEREDLDREIVELIDLQKKQKIRSSNALAGNPTGLKPGYHLVNGMAMEDD